MRRNADAAGIAGLQNTGPPERLRAGGHPISGRQAAPKDCHGR